MEAFQQRVVSLWDMLQTGTLHHLLDDQSLISAFAQQFRNASSVGFRSESDIVKLRERSLRYAKGLKAFGLEVASRHADRLHNGFLSAALVPEKENNYVIPEDIFGEFKMSLSYLHNGSLAFEAEAQKFVVIASNKSAMLADDYSLFGLLVDSKFPSVIDESQESAKCFALSRYTASAFHSLRCLEAGIRAICRCLGIPDPLTGAERNWSNISKSIKVAMDAKWPGKADKMTQDYVLFDQIHAAISAMQNPYRNETMHLSARYDEDGSRHLIEMVRGLMKRVSARCDENGLPLA